MEVAILNEKYRPYVSGDAEKSVKILADACRAVGERLRSDHLADRCLDVYRTAVDDARRRAA